MTRYYADRARPQSGFYEIQESEDGYRWRWTEPVTDQECDDFGKWRETRAEALRDAAWDWDSNGSPDEYPRLAPTLRGLATRAELTDLKEN